MSGYFTKSLRKEFVHRFYFKYITNSFRTACAVSQIAPYIIGTMHAEGERSLNVTKGFRMKTRIMAIAIGVSLAVFSARANDIL